MVWAPSSCFFEKMFHIFSRFPYFSRLTPLTIIVRKYIINDIRKDFSAKNER